MFYLPGTIDSRLIKICGQIIFYYIYLKQIRQNLPFLLQSYLVSSKTFKGYKATREGLKLKKYHIDNTSPSGFLLIVLRILIVMSHLRHKQNLKRHKVNFLDVDRTLMLDDRFRLHFCRCRGSALSEIRSRVTPPMSCYVLKIQG